MGDKIKWAAQVHGVRELSLLGSADANYWRRRLKSANLAPLEHEGRAQVLLIAAQLRFAGVRFHELSISVFATRSADHAEPSSTYLVRAYNSNRFFAFCERAFFSTPYYPADLKVVAGYPGSITLEFGAHTALVAKLVPDPLETERQPTRTADDGWEGPVYLPGKTEALDGRKLFHVKLRGLTKTYAFMPGWDAFNLTPGPHDHALRTLVDSGFTPREWSLREDAFHAKSKTYPAG